LDSILPESIQLTVDSINPELTLFLLSSKSGTTTEQLILYAFFRNLLEREWGKEKADRYFVAITDERTPLIRLAEQETFRYIFLNQPYIESRYSVLSYFGLVPAALICILAPRLG
jgi:transaldolase/glucose-6-phosphate isomerase